MQYFARFWLQKSPFYSISPAMTAYAACTQNLLIKICNKQHVHVFCHQQNDLRNLNKFYPLDIFKLSLALPPIYQLLAHMHYPNSEWTAISYILHIWERIYHRKQFSLPVSSFSFSYHQHHPSAKKVVSLYVFSLKWYTFQFKLSNKWKSLHYEIEFHFLEN